MAKSRTYPGFDRADLDRLRAELARLGFPVPDGDDVVIRGPHGVSIRAVHDEAASVLTLTILSRPFFAPESRIWAAIDKALAKP